MSRGLSFTFAGDNNIDKARRAEGNNSVRMRLIQGPPSGSGKAQPVSPEKHFTVLQDKTPGFQCGRSHTGVEHRQPSPMHTNTKTPRCERSLYTPEVGTDHPGQASGAGPSLNQPESSGTANAYPGAPALPGTPLDNPRGKLTSRFGSQVPPAPNPPDQRVPTEEHDGVAQLRAPSLLAFPVPKAGNAARLAAVTPGLITAPTPAENDATSPNFTSQSVQNNSAQHIAQHEQH